MAPALKGKTVKPSDRHLACASPGTARTRRRLVGAVAAAGLALAGAAAQATLGGATASIETDRQQVGAQTVREAHPAFAVHILTTADGGTVREYVSPAGVVFAVSWNGPAKPDLRQLLGVHFDTLGRSQNRHAPDHRHLAIHEGNIVFESQGRMRAFRGRAYLTDALPAGVTANDIE